MMCSVSRSSMTVPDPSRRRKISKLSQIEPLFDEGTAIFFDHLPHPLASGVVDEVGVTAARQIHRAAVDRESPIHARQMRHGGHIAVRVVGVRFGSGTADDGGAQPIAILARLG